MPPTPFFDLLNALDSQNTNKFEPFKILTTKYKHFGAGTSHCNAHVLIPKVVLAKVKPSVCPIIVRIHGGFLVTGSSLYAPWFSNWILDYGIKHGAIIVSPNYRLLPEATGRDILEDMDDFWGWLQSGNLTQLLAAAGHTTIAADLERLLIVGESAGGYLAVQLALSYPRQIRAVIAAYPMLDLRSSFYTKAYSKPIVGVPNIPDKIIKIHMKSLSQHLVQPVTAADPPERLELAFAIVQNGVFLEFFGSDDPALFPLERAKGLIVEKCLELPPMFLFHGRQDSAVPVEGTECFVQLLRQKAPYIRVDLHIQDGDHGFDMDATMETEWLKRGLAMTSMYWIGAKGSL